MSREEYMRFHSVRRWVEQCGCSAYTEPVMDVSDRWCGSVYGQIISPSRPIPVKGTMEMLSTHFLLVSSDSDAVLYSIEVDAVKSIHRVDYTHFPSGNLAGGGNGRRSSSKKGGGSDDDDQHQGRAPPGRAAAVAGGGGGGSTSSSYLRTVVELLVSPLSEVGRKAAAGSSSPPLSEDEDNDDGKEAYGEEDLVRILVSLDGPEGRHFAAGMEMLWCMRFERLSLRQRAISRSSHTSDVVFILSMLPLDVSCELLQIHEPQPGISSSTQQQESSLLGASSRRILGNNNNNTPPPTPMSITNVSKPVNLRITEDYKICVVFRPDTAYAGMAAAHAAYADLLGPEDPHPSTIFLKAMNFHMDNVLLLTVTNNQLRVALRSGTVYVFGSLDLFGLDKDKSSNSSSNQVQTSDGSRAGGGGVSQRGSMSPMGSPRGVNEGSVAYDDTSDDRSSFNFNATFTAPLSPRFPASNNATVTFSQEEEESGLQSIPQYEAPPLIKARRKTADEFTKAVSGVDVAGMSRGVRCVLDVYLLFAATSCYQSLYLKAASAPHMGKTQQHQHQTPNRRRTSKGTPIGPLTSSIADASNTDDDIEPGKVIRDQIPTVALPDYIPNRRCFRGNDIYIIYQHFLNVDSNYDGCLSSAEFLSCIGPALVGSDGALPRAVYSLFDVLHNDVVQVAEYFFGCRVLLKGSVEDRLLFLFNGLFDTHQRGVINYQQFHSGMSYVSKVLRLKGRDIQSQTNGGEDEDGVGGGSPLGGDTSASNITASSSSPLAAGGGRGLSIFANRAVKTKVATHGDVLLSDDQLRAFTREVFRSIDTNGDQEVDFQEFCVGMTRNQGVIRALQQDTNDGGGGGGDDDSAPPPVTGSNQDILSKFSKDDPSREVGNPLKIVSFGHPKWKEVVLILAGIETSVSSSEAGASTVSQKSYGEKVIHDCSQFGNIAPSVEALLGSLSSPSSNNNTATAAVNGGGGGRGGGGSQSKRFSLGGRGGESSASPPSDQAPPASPRGGSSSSKAQSVLFNDYCPAVFCAIRRAFGITQEAYTKSLGLQHLRSNLLFGSLNTLFAMSSSGRSGSFFYASHDFKFILKTIPGSESEMLRKILPSYYAHIIKYEHTLLTRFCGLHALHVDGKKLNFVVMQNIFQNKIPVHVSYDLKGSTVNRSTPNILRGPGVALKDNDFGKRRVYMRADLKAQLMRQLDADSAMLTSYNLNDYSFLLGVHESVVGPLPMCDRRTCPSPCHNAFQRFHGGIEGRKPIDLTADPNPQLSAMHSENQVWTMGDDHEDDDGDEWTMVRKASPIHEMHARKQRPSSLSASVSIGGWHGQEVLEYAAAESGLAATAPLLSTATTTTAGENGTPTNGVNSHTMQYEVYFMGVIDILTDYGMKKKGEHHAKSILYDSKQVSCVPPQEYRQRYLKYLDMIIEGI